MSDGNDVTGDRDEGEPAPRGQPGPPQSQPAIQGQPTGGGRPEERADRGGQLGRSARNRTDGAESSLLGELLGPRSVHCLRFNVGVLSGVGVGFGLAFLLAFLLAPSDLAQRAVFTPDEAARETVVFVGLLVPTILAGGTGVWIGIDLDAERTVAVANSFLGALVGTFLFGLVVYVFIRIAPATGNLNLSGSLSFPKASLVGLAIGAGVAGALATYVTQRA